jgi:hypothetical protein
MCSVVIHCRENVGYIFSADTGFLCDEISATAGVLRDEIKWTFCMCSHDDSFKGLGTLSGQQKFLLIAE